MTRAQLKTARLTLRPVAPEDEGAVVACLNDIAVSGWLSTIPHPYAPRDFTFFLIELAKQGETFVIEDSQGFCGIVGAEGGELGYWFAPRCHGQGFATEAARAVMAAQFGHKRKDWISGHFEGNTRSANVLRKLGFVETGRSTKHCRALGIDRPHIDMSLTRSAFIAALPIEAQSDRMTFRSLQATDLDALHAIVSHFDVVRQLASYPWPPDREFTRTRAQPYAGRGFVWGAFQQGRLIGTVAVTGDELGYMFTPETWGHGLATEAGATALGRAFENPDLQEVTASAWDDNLTSLSLLQKLGFRELRRTVEKSKARKVESGLVHMALSRTNWFARPSA